MFGAEDYAWAGIVLGIIGSTDWVDGQLARRLGQVSELGKFLDPLADRLAIVAAVIGGWIAGVLPWGFALALVAREAVMAGGVLVVAVRAKARLDVRWLGKAATLALYFSISAFYVAAGVDPVIWDVFAWGFGIPGLAAYYVVGVQYLGDARRLLAGEQPVSSGADDQGGNG